MLVETKNLSKVYGDKVAVNGLDIQIERGSFTAIFRTKWRRKIHDHSDADRSLAADIRADLLC